MIAKVLCLDLTKVSDKARVKTMLKKWIETDVLRVERLTHGDKKRPADFVFAGENNPAVQE